MNYHNYQVALTRSQQRIKHLIALKRPLTVEESEDLYRALHADYMRKWRLAKAEAEALKREAAIVQADLDLSRVELKEVNHRLLKRVLLEARP
jgi:class 3 adenylate cyclase